MIPLTMMNGGDVVLVQRVSGNADTRQHLADLGFVPGTELQVISQHSGDVIVNVRETHLAITKQMAEKVFVAPKA